LSLTRDPRLVEVAKKICRELRKNQTVAEKIFREAVRNRKFRGLKFYRQYPLFFDYIGKETFYVADFYCFEKRFIVEIDGIIHNYQKERDTYRTFIIQMLGIDVIRFKNEEIEKNIQQVLKKLENWLDKNKKS